MHNGENSGGGSGGGVTSLNLLLTSST